MTDWAERAAQAKMDGGSLAEIDAFTLALRAEHRRAVRIVKQVGNVYGGHADPVIQDILAALTRGRGRTT